MSAPITIIGTGLAGYNLARELRKQDAEVAIRIVTGDAGDFYSKPMLSNGLAGNKTAAQLAMKPASKMAEELRADVVTGIRVTAVDAQAHTLETSAGKFEYSKLVLAIGADPFTPPMAGDAVDKVICVNDLADYARFRQLLEGKRRVALLGAGLIGCEFANDLASQGIEVDAVDLAAWPLSRLLPEAAGRHLQSALAALGIRFHLGTSTESVDVFGEGYRVRLANGDLIDADLVLSAIGLRPRVELARAAGLTTNRGIVVDRLLQTSAADIYALGDCAEVEGHVLPFVLPIMQAVRALAPTLLGRPTPVVYPAMPVVVKTPACPTVVSPPAAGAAGSWQIEASQDAVKALFVGPDDQLLGLALLGAATSERQALAPQLPAILS
ncbi:MAG: FAD-dependent oxidoreductase [Burkholderiales bacterium]|nr:FAD-dependent oxidoreductase [Burkholderiales bacterium]